MEHAPDIIRRQKGAEIQCSSAPLNHLRLGLSISLDRGVDRNEWFLGMLPHG